MSTFPVLRTWEVVSRLFPGKRELWAIMACWKTRLHCWFLVLYLGQDKPASSGERWVGSGGWGWGSKRESRGLEYSHHLVTLRSGQSRWIVALSPASSLTSGDFTTPSHFSNLRWAYCHRRISLLMKRACSCLA